MFGQSNTTGAKVSLYVGNLDSSVTDKDLIDEFSNYGRVVMSHVVLDRETRQSRGYGYVNFTTAEEADNALIHANFSKLKGKEMRVMPQQSKFSQNTDMKGNLFVKNIPDKMDNKCLLDSFSGYGNILSCKVAYNAETGASLHYGYVHFSDPNIAQEVLSKLNKNKVEEGSMYVQPYERHQADTTSEWTSCYVGNFPLSMKQEELQNLFAPYGKIVSVYVGTKSYDTTKVQGFVCFVNHEDAVKAVEGLKDMEIMDNDVPMKLYVNRLQNHEERSRANQQMLLQRKKESMERTKGRFLYVGFGSEFLTAEELRDLFAPFGQIESCSIAKDRITRKPKPCGFVCMDSVENANAALTSFQNNQQRRFKVELAQTHEERSLILKEKRRQNPRMFNSAMPYGYMPYPQMPLQAMSVNMQRNEQHNRMPMMQPMMGPMMGRNPYSQYIPQTIPQEKTSILAMAMSQCEPITAASIEPLSEEDRRNAFGERIFTLVSAIGDPRVSKITGMMLELTTSDLLHMVSDPSELYSKVVEANQVLDMNQPQA